MAQVTHMFEKHTLSGRIGRIAAGAFAYALALVAAAPVFLVFAAFFVA